MAPRRKAASIEAPQTIQEATRLIAQYLELGANVDETRAAADASIREIEAVRDETIAPTEARMKDIFMQLRTWWTVARNDLTEGKRKSIQLAGALIGDRITPPALKLPKGAKVQDLIDKVLAEFAGDFLITKHALDKAEIVKTLRMTLDATDPADMLARDEQRRLSEKIGFSWGQKEEFFIDRAAKAEPDPVMEVSGEDMADAVP